jgi:hypothetical protein
VAKLGAVLHIYAALTEKERRLISERTRRACRCQAARATFNPIKHGPKRCSVPKRCGLCSRSL